MADKGVLFIDELDKCHDRYVLLDAMEQQKIFIAKAGIVCPLPARTTVISAANPFSGHYDSSKSIEENIRIEPQVISRFDLLFILKDNIPNIGSEGTVYSPVSKSDITSYINAAKTFVVDFSLDFEECLSSYYMSNRRNKISSKSRMTPRDLHSLIRLSISFAKAEFSSIVHPKHAASAIELW